MSLRDEAETAETAEPVQVEAEDVSEDFVEDFEGEGFEDSTRAEQEDDVSADEEGNDDEHAEEGGTQETGGVCADYKSRMQLTQEEHQWALAIKRAIEQDHELDNVTDFWCAQLALVDGMDIDHALERTRHIQYFKKEYDIVESLEYACRIGREFQGLLPQFWMALQFNERDGNYVLSIDIAKCYANVLTRNERSIQAWLSAMYFIFHAMNPDFEAIRQGPVVLAENEGFDWKRNFGVDLYRRLWTEVAGVYPLNFQQLKSFNTGVLMSVLISMSRGFIPARIYSKVQMGCKSGASRLDELFMIPSVHVANERFLDSTRNALQKRYANEACFSL